MLSQAFLFAGNASFVIENPSGESVTVKVTRGKTKINPRTQQPYTPSYFFVSIRHNNRAWSYVGITQNGTQIAPTPHASRDNPRAVRIAEWAMRLIVTQESVPAGYRLEHTGHCGRCGKMLRNAESIALGLGPVCRG